MNDPKHWFNQHHWFWNVFWPAEQARLEALKVQKTNEQAKK